jgi:hypothetical protein
VAIEIWTGFVSRSVGDGIALGETLIHGRRGGHVVLGAAEGPLVVECPNHEVSEAAYFLDRKGAVAEPVEVEYVYTIRLDFVDKSVRAFSRGTPYWIST